MALDKEQSVVGDAFKLMLVTAQRRGEVLNMRWQDFSGSWWTIPAEQSKNALSHRVPLSPQAFAVLDKLRARSGGGDFVFPSDKRPDRPIASPGHGAQRLWRASRVKDARFHDFRRTAASFMASLGIPRLTIARVLNHAERDVTAVYDRHSYDAEKRTVLEAWGRKLDSIFRGEDQAADVLPFSAGRA